MLEVDPSMPSVGDEVLPYMQDQFFGGMPQNPGGPPMPGAMERFMNTQVPRYGSDTDLPYQSMADTEAQDAAEVSPMGPPAPPTEQQRQFSPMGGGIRGGIAGDLAGQGLGNASTQAPAYQNPLNSQGFTSAGAGGKPSYGGQLGSISEGRSDAMNADMPGGSAEDSKGIGLMGTLGIINMGAGLGAQIYKMATRKKPEKPRMAVPTGGGVSFK